MFLCDQSTDPNVGLPPTQATLSLNPAFFNSQGLKRGRRGLDLRIMEKRIFVDVFPDIWRKPAWDAREENNPVETPLFLVSLGSACNSVFPQGWCFICYAPLVVSGAQCVLTFLPQEGLFSYGTDWKKNLGEGVCCSTAEDVSAPWGNLVRTSPVSPAKASRGPWGGAWEWAKAPTSEDSRDPTRCHRRTTSINLWITLAEFLLVCRCIFPR